MEGGEQRTENREQRTENSVVIGRWARLARRVERGSGRRAPEKNPEATTAKKTRRAQTMETIHSSRNFDARRRHCMRQEAGIRLRNVPKVNSNAYFHCTNLRDDPGGVESVETPFASVEAGEEDAPRPNNRNNRFFRGGRPGESFGRRPRKSAGTQPRKRVGTRRT
jgi:hypothetical protein